MIARRDVAAKGKKKTKMMTEWTRQKRRDCLGRRKDEVKAREVRNKRE